MSSGEVYTPIEVALIDYEDSVISRILIGMVKGSDYISNVLSVKNMDEDDAMEALRRGECAAVIVLPEGFLDNIFYGRESEASIYLSKSAAAQSTVVEAIANFGERLILAGQAGVFAGENVLLEHEVSYDIREEFNNSSNLKLIDEAMGATSRYFHVEVVGYVDTGMSTSSYYALCWLTLLLMLTSLFFAPMLQCDCTKEMLCRLHTLGIGNFKFMVWKTVLPAVFRLVIALLVFAFAGEFLGITWNPIGVIFAFISVCYISIIGGAITMCLGDGITANVIFGIGGMVLVGGLIPRQLLPEVLCKIGDMTPFGVAAGLMKPMFSAGVSLISLILGVVYTVLAVLIIGRTLNKTRTGGGNR